MASPAAVAPSREWNSTRPSSNSTCFFTSQPLVPPETSGVTSHETAPLRVASKATPAVAGPATALAAFHCGEQSVASLAISASVAQL